MRAKSLLFKENSLGLFRIPKRNIVFQIRISQKKQVFYVYWKKFNLNFILYFYYFRVIFHTPRKRLQISFGRVNLLT